MSEYKNFLMIGKIFSVCIEIVPFSCIAIFVLVNTYWIQCPYQGLFQLAKNVILAEKQNYLVLLCILPFGTKHQIGIEESKLFYSVMLQLQSISQE